jgi:uncharacterized protein YdcH (DUF465 family)
MEKSDELLIERYIEEDAELRQYVEEHKQYEDKLEVFKSRIHLSADEEVRRKVLQKMKLLGKERIYSILEKYRRV